MKYGCGHRKEIRVLDGQRHLDANVRKIKGTSMLLRCANCNLTYAAMTTGYTFASVRREMFVHTPDRSQWRQKRRKSVLGFWHELKLQLWAYHLDQCEGIE